jgi:periplasmic divalent cation tolerance protein
MDAMLILTTADSDSLAERIATSLVESGDAACVSIVAGLRSIYRWEGKVCNEKELLLLIKSTAERFESVRAHVRRLHSYQVPEVIGLPVSAIDADYLQLQSQTSDRC